MAMDDIRMVHKLLRKKKAKFSYMSLHQVLQRIAEEGVVCKRGVFRWNENLAVWQEDEGVCWPTPAGVVEVDPG